MRTILTDEIKNEQYLSAAVGAYSAAIGDGATESEAAKVASDVAKEHWQDGETPGNIDRGFHIRDTLVSVEEFNRLSPKDKKEMLALKNEFNSSGYVDVRTAMGPDQWSRVSKRQSDSIQKNMLNAFRIEDRVKQLKKSPEQKYSDKRESLIKKAKTSYVQGKSMVNTLKNFKAVQSKRMNGTKRSYQEALNKMQSGEKALKRLNAFNNL